MKKIFLFLFYFIAVSATASHIVGGEFELLYIGQFPGDFRYRVNLIVYFDVVNGNPGAKDATAFARIYRVSDNVMMMDRLAIPLSSESRVNYTQPQCTSSEVITDRQLYTTDITLPGTQYNDPQGYYIVWERCCRNYSIVNAISNPAGSTGILAGQTFYLKFPPVVKNGVPFINSSPSLFKPLSDYACPSRPYYANFEGFDVDGDSIGYSIVTPLSTHSGDATPPILPAPYPLITWRSPFSINNIMGGYPDLKISKDGFLTVTPGINAGPYVFAVKCEEFRNGEKIGETRRDFQLYVSSSCPDAEPPQIVGKKLSEATYSNVHQPLYVEFQNTVSDNDRCVEVQVYDPDALKSTQGFAENIGIRIIPLNFKKDLSALLPAISTATLTKQDSVKTFTICFSDCPYIEGPFLIGVIAYDDACALPLTDTLKITVNIIPPTNHKPYFDTPDVTETVSEGTVKTWSILGKDIDPNVLTATVVPVGFDMNKVGMGITVLSNATGEYTAALQWNTDCSLADFTNQTHFIIKIFLEDADHCEFKHPAVMTFNLTLDDHDVAPIISSSLKTKTNHRFDSVTFTIFEKPALTFTVTGKDADSDFIMLGGDGKDFKINDYDINFPGTQGTGNISSIFEWPINCDYLDLKQKSKFDLRFIVVDKQNKCHIYKADTLDVNIALLPAPNAKPRLTVTSLEAGFPLFNNSLSTVIGQQITLGLYGADGDQNPADFLKLELLEIKDATLPPGHVFQSHNGNSIAEGVFSWLPDCSIFKNGIYENNYNLFFRVTDERCHDIKGDTVKVNLTVKDINSGEDEFLPPNVITPNGDEFNEYFAMEGIDPIISAEVINDPNENIALPKDNCIRQFENIKIYNRWGKEVFTSNQRNFRWYAHDAVVGVYFYTLKYTDKEYKGTISVRQ